MSHATTPQPPQWALDAAEEIAEAVDSQLDSHDYVHDGSVLAAIIARHAPNAPELAFDPVRECEIALGRELAAKDADLARLREENERLRVGLAKLLVSSFAAQGRDMEELRNDPILAKHYPAEVFAAKLLNEM